MNERDARMSRDLFESGFYCAESVLMAIASSRGIQSDLIPRIATGFCSGMARTGGLCGAVSGAIMGISLATGRDSPSANVKENYALVRELLQRFEERYASTNCRALIGCDLNTVRGQLTFRTNHLRDRCAQFTEGATEIALELIEETETQK